MEWKQFWSLQTMFENGKQTVWSNMSLNCPENVAVNCALQEALFSIASAANMTHAAFTCNSEFPCCKFPIWDQKKEN